MSKQVIGQWNITSQSNPNNSHEVTFYSDGNWACSCPHWTYSHQECKHVKKGKELYNKNYAQNVNLEEAGIEIDHYGFLCFWLEIKDRGCPAVLDYEEEDVRNQLLNAHKIVIQDEKIKIPITYPLSTELTFEYEKEGGFARLDLFKYLYEAYKKIYEEEEAAVGDPGTHDRLYNRKRSNGPHGIWGHYLSDLFIESLRYDPASRTLHVFIGS